MFNWMIVRWTGQYKKYTWATFKAKEISLDPISKIIVFPQYQRRWTVMTTKNNKLSWIFQIQSMIFILLMSDDPTLSLIVIPKKRLVNDFRILFMIPLVNGSVPIGDITFTFQLMLTNTRKGNHIIWQISCFISQCIERNNYFSQWNLQTTYWWISEGECHSKRLSCFGDHPDAKTCNCW